MKTRGDFPMERLRDGMRQHPFEDCVGLLGRNDVDFRRKGGPERDIGMQISDKDEIFLQRMHPDVVTRTTAANPGDRHNKFIKGQQFRNQHALVFRLVQAFSDDRAIGKEASHRGLLDLSDFNGEFEIGSNAQEVCRRASTLYIPT